MRITISGVLLGRVVNRLAAAAAHPRNPTGGRLPTIKVVAAFSAACFFLAPLATAAPLQALRGHVPEAVAHLHLAPAGRLPATNRMHLVIGVALRNQEGLNSLVQQIYDPTSPNYRHYITPEQFAAQFGPTEEDYQKVVEFAQASGFKVSSRYDSRRLLEVDAPVSEVERAFRVRVLSYQHPTEARRFYAPDAEPTVDGAVPIASIANLNDYILPHPMSRRRPVGTPLDNGAPEQFGTGSAPDGSGGYFGTDFRIAYLGSAGGNTGAGQIIGLLEFGQTIDPTSFNSYTNAAGINTSMTNIVLNGARTYGDGVTNGEAALDVEVAIAMAPGASVVVFDGTDTNPILDAMVARTNILQFSASWGYGVDATSDTYFLQMAAQGQSFFNSSGDSDSQPSSSLGLGFSSADPYVISVGGTTLTTTSNHIYVSEKVWNWGSSFKTNDSGQVTTNGTGSTGGITKYPLPSWQVSAVGGLFSNRCIPDVALTADNVFVISADGTNYGVRGNFGGTSCASPLWAGYLALVNAQALAGGNPSAGFINPAVYSMLGSSSTNAAYVSGFRDITNGDNAWLLMPNQYPATNGYDLSTGLGTPTFNLLHALAVYTNTIVSSTNDSGPRSLRYIIATAGSGATITFAPNLSGATILLTNGELLLNKNLAIDASMLPNGVQINGKGASRVFEVASGMTVALKSLTITNGAAGAGFGGGILNGGTLSLSQCALIGNSAHQGGGIENSGACAMTNCTLSLNVSAANGAAVDDNVGSLSLTHCTLFGNSAGGSGGGIANFLRTATLLNCIVAGNSSSFGADIRSFAQSTVISSGSNLVQVALNDSGSTNLGTAFITSPPQLGALGNYGGPTPTMQPLAGSPAIDAAVATSLNIDQRGYQRPAGPAPDIGAVEFQDASPVVTTLANSGIGSLRYATSYTTNGAAIIFAPGLSGQTITLTNGELFLNHNLTIDASALTNGLTINGNHASRIFQVGSGVSAVLNALTITNGNDTGPNAGGGGILCYGTLTLNNCTLAGNSANQATWGGGGILNYFGTVAINQSTLSGNSANNGTSGGAVINYSGTVTMSQSTVSGNSANSDGGGIRNGGTLTVTNSIVAGNSGGNISGAFSGTNNLTSGTPLLAVLGNYGGPTPTMPPLPGSPAIDGCTNGTGFTKDQRGLPRVVGPFADLGAVEFQDASPVVTTSADSGIGSLRYATTYTTNGAAITFAPGLSGSTILLTNGELFLTKNLAINASALTNGLTINGNHTSRIFQVGGVTAVLSSLTITNGNDTGPNAGGGGILNYGTLTLNQCTLAGNSANQPTWGGAGILSYAGALTINQCTLSGNSANNGTPGGALENYFGTLTINQSTVSGNSAATKGGGVYTYEGTLIVTNSLIAGDTASSGPDIYTTNSTIIAGGLNIVQSLVNIGGTLQNPAAILALNPSLAPLGNYGGPTPTMPPLAGSPAIDSGGPTTFTTDQRGFPRVMGLAPDIGAVELQTPHLVVTTAADSVAGSLRQLISQVDVSSTLTFTSTLSSATLTLTNGELVLNKNLTIDASTLTNGITINGNQNGSVFSVAGGATCVLTALTITNGLVNGSGGGINNQGNLTLNGCSLVGNVATDYGGGIENGGTLTVNQSTFTANVCNGSFGGAGIDSSSGSLTLIQSTVSGNRATDPNGAGGIFFYGGAGTLSNSIVAGNTAPTLTNLAANFTLVTNGVNVINLNPRLAPLANYGGPTPTMLPLPGSPAIDECFLGTSFTTDQRGFPRVVGTYADVGAVESGNAIPGFTPVVTANGDALNPIGVGGVTLREAVTFAASNAIITFATNLSGATITLTNGQLVLDRRLTIDASGLSNGIVINGGGTSRVFEIDSTKRAWLYSLTISNGFDTTGLGGGGVLISPNAFLTASNCTFVGNASTYFGGAIRNEGGTLTVNQSTFAGNSSTNGGGGIGSAGTTIINQCTLSQNSTLGTNGGGGIFIGSSQFGLSNSIVAGNSAPAGAALDIHNAAGGLNYSGANIVQSFSGGSPAGPAPINAAPQLAPLGNYGGPTATMLPLPGSPAIDGCTNGTSFTKDQRGLPRVVGPFADIGALESGNAIPGFSPVVTVNNDAINPIGVGGVSLREAIAFAASNSSITFAPGLSGQTITLTNSGGGLALNLNVTIDGSPLANGITLSGNHATRIFQVGGGVTAVLNALTLRDANGGGGDGGAILNAGNTTLNDCTLTANATGSGGAILNNQPGSMALNNCTLTGNSSAPAGGGGAIVNKSLLAINNCTLFNNTSQFFGGAIYNDTTGTLDLTNSIVAGPSTPNLYQFGPVNGRSNLVDTANVNLAPLGNYGGPTPTMPPLPGSPAIDAGSDAAASMFTTDQRGAGYPRLVGAHVDIGAVEGVYNAAGPGRLTGPTRLGNGSFKFGFTNYTDTLNSVLVTTNVALPLNLWSNLGAALESPPGSGQFQFTDPQATNYARRFYRVRSP